MPLGVLLTEWDNTLGAVVKAAFPAQYPISKDTINKVLMAHSMSKVKKAETLEFHIQDKVILSYCPKDKITTLGYSMLIVVFHESEAGQISRFKDKMEGYGKNVFGAGPGDCLAFFKKIRFDIFAKKTSRKLLFVGTSAVGKTSIKKTFFECVSSDELLNKPLEPTYGIVHYTYDWLDLDLGIADLAGQEMEHFLQNLEISDLDPFEGVDIVIYIFDPSYWEEKPLAILKHLEQVTQKMRLAQPEAKLFVFCHKIDLVPPDSLEAFQSDIKEKLVKITGDNLFFTSIKQVYLPELFHSMQKILGQVSKQTSEIEGIIYREISSLDGLAVLILRDDKILLEISTSDFPPFQFAQLVPMFASIQHVHKNFGRKLSHFRLKLPAAFLYYDELAELSQESILIISIGNDTSTIEGLYDSIKEKLRRAQIFTPSQV